MMTDAEMIECPDKGRQLERLRAIMHRLRAPGGCSWDAKQTHQSLLPHLIEETYEAVDAIRREDHPHLMEELGDVLLQVVFHAELAKEAGRYDLDDIARGVSDKLVRRHPHVFGESVADDPDAVLKQWDAIKRVEKGEADDQPYLKGVGSGLPALPRAAKLQKKAAKVGFDWPEESGVMAKLREELDELHEAVESGMGDAIAEELGDLMFSAVNLARFRGFDPEVLMAEANAKFEARFHEMERLLRKRDLTLEAATAGQMEAAWEEAKRGATPNV